MRTPAAALLPLLLAGCAGEPANPLRTEHTYLVEWIGERPLIDRSHLTVTFGADGRAFGSGGCNHWFAGYQLDGAKLRFEQPGSTRKAWESAQERRRFCPLVRACLACHAGPGPRM